MIPIQIVILLAIATGALLIGRWLRLPPIVAYLVGGLLAGPGGFGWVTQSETIRQLAELGVALLLFGVGIEFSLERIRRILPRMLTSGLLQVGLTILITTLLYVWFGIALPKAIFAGFVESFSMRAEAERTLVWRRAAQQTLKAVSSPLIPKGAASNSVSFSHVVWGAWSVAIQSMVPSRSPSIRA